MAPPGLISSLGEADLVIINLGCLSTPRANTPGYPPIKQDVAVGQVVARIPSAPVFSICHEDVSFMNRKNRRVLPQF